MTSSRDKRSFPWASVFLINSSHFPQGLTSSFLIHINQHEFHPVIPEMIPLKERFFNYFTPSPSTVERPSLVSHFSATNWLSLTYKEIHPDDILARISLLSISLIV